MASSLLSERLAVVATIDPDAYTTGTQTSDIIDMLYHERVLFIVEAGTLGSSGTLDFSVYGSAAANMASSAVLTGKSITQLTQAGSDADKQALVNVSASEVVAQGFRYIQGSLIIGTQTSDCGVMAIAEPAHYGPANDHDLASVDEIVA